MADFAPVRQVEEWVGASPDTPAPDRVKLRVFERWGGRCYLSGIEIRPGMKWEVEHVIAIANGGENRESNLRPALKDAHKPKTRADLKRKAKIAITAKKHRGLAKSKRGFRCWRRMNGEIVWRDKGG